MEILSASGPDVSGRCITNEQDIYASVTGNVTGEDYIGPLLIGDVTGKWNNTGARKTGGPKSAINLSLADSRIIADKEVVVAIQPAAEPVEVAGTVSPGLIAVTNAGQPGLLRVVLYRPIPIDEDGLPLKLKFTVVGAIGGVSPLSFERIMFNKGEPTANFNYSERAVSFLDLTDLHRRPAWSHAQTVGCV